MTHLSPVVLKNEAAKKIEKAVMQVVMNKFKIFSSNSIKASRLPDQNQQVGKISVYWRFSLFLFLIILQ